MHNVFHVKKGRPPVPKSPDDSPPMYVPVLLSQIIWGKGRADQHKISNPPLFWLNYLTWGLNQDNGA